METTGTDLPANELRARLQRANKRLNPYFHVSPRSLLQKEAHAARHNEVEALLGSICEQVGLTEDQAIAALLKYIVRTEDNETQRVLERILDEVAPNWTESAAVVQLGPHFEAKAADPGDPDQRRAGSLCRQLGLNAPSLEPPPVEPTYWGVTASTPEEIHDLLCKLKPDVEIRLSFRPDPSRERVRTRQLRLRRYDAESHLLVVDEEQRTAAFYNIFSGDEYRVTEVHVVDISLDWADDDM